MLEMLRENEILSYDITASFVFWRSFHSQFVQQTYLNI